MKTIINSHKATPQEAIDFAQHLLQKFPLNKAYQICIEFSSKNSVGKNAWGRAKNWNYTKLCIHLEIALGFSKERRDLPGLLHTLAHEYCHALQYDRGEEGDCAEADKFADQIVPEFLSLSPQGSSGSTASQIALKETARTGVATRDLPTLQRRTPMIQKIKAHPATPQEAIDFFNHLLNSFPITNQRQCIIEFISTNSTGRHAHGRAFHWPVMGTIYLEVALGNARERRPLARVLHTVAHEYCHALQYDQDRPADCKEADKFGDMEAGDFLKKQEKAQLA